MRRQLKSLSGGLDTTSPTFQVSSNDFIAYQNVDVSERYFAKQRAGTSAYSDATETYKIEDMYRYEDSSGSGKFFFSSGTKLWYTDDSTGAATAFASDFSYGAKGDFEYYNGKVYYVNDIDGLYEIDPTVSTPTSTKVSGFEQKGNRIKAWKNRLFICGDPDNPRKLYYNSTLLSVTAWNDEIKCDYNVVGFETIVNYMYVFTDSRIYHLAEDVDYLFALRETQGSTGCFARKSITRTNNGIVFLAKDGVFYFNGATVSKISYKVDNELSNKTGEEVGIFFNNTFYLAYGATGYNDKMLVCDLANLKYLRWSKWVNVFANNFAIYDKAIYFSSPKPSLYFIGRLNRGNRDITGYSGGWTYTNIEFDVRTGYSSITGDYAKVKKFKKIWTEYKPLGSDTMSVMYYLDGVETATTDTINFSTGSIWGGNKWGGFTWGGTTKMFTNEIATTGGSNVGKQISWRYYKNSYSPPMTIYSSGIDFKNKSGRR